MLNPLLRPISLHVCELAADPVGKIAVGHPENNLAQQTLKTKQEFEELRVNYENSKSSLATYREHFALYQDNYSLARYKYQHDVYNTDQLLQVYAEKLRSQNQYLTAMGNYYISRMLIQLKNEFANPENALPYE